MPVRKHLRKSRLTPVVYVVFYNCTNESFSFKAFSIMMNSSEKCVSLIDNKKKGYVARLEKRLLIVSNGPTLRHSVSGRKLHA